MEKEEIIEDLVYQQDLVNELNDMKESVRDLTERVKELESEIRALDRRTIGSQIIG